MNPTLLNREFKHPDDGWYHIEPKGEHPNRASQVVQVIDDAAGAAIVKRFNADANAGKLSHGQEMLIDHEHFKHEADKETIAYGWLQKLECRADGIYGQVRWSATGQNAVDGGDYRFFSTEYDPADLEVLNPRDAGSNQEGLRPNRKVRPQRLDGLTLTNEPNNKGARPITNRKSSRDAVTFAGAVAPAANQPTTNQAKSMKNIAMKLGLAAEASEDAILAEVTKIQTRITTLEPLSAENATLMNRNTELEAEQVEVLLDAHGIKPEDSTKREKLKPVLVSLKNRADRQAFLKECVPSGSSMAAEDRQREPNRGNQTKLHNRDTRPPGGGKQPASDNVQAEKVNAQKIMNRAREIKKETPNISDATAVCMAQKELAD